MRKYLTFLFAQTLALVTLSAIAVLTINLMSRSGIHDHLCRKTYMLIVIYSEIPLCFICAFLAGMIYRSNPVFLAVVFVLLKTIARLLCVSYIAYSSHFWLESTISLFAAIAGAYASFSLLPSGHREKPIHPLLAASVALAVSSIAWLLTLHHATSR